MADPVQRDKKYTWDDYLEFPDDERWELILGEPFLMAAPRTRHQAILQELGRQFGNHFEDKPCSVFPAPTDVKLSDEDVVQPDLLVVCDPKQITDTHIEGPPDLVVEILSPSTYLYDRTQKLPLYARKGVKEVWLVNPFPWLVEVFVLSDAGYLLDATFKRSEAAVSRVFPALKIDLKKVFNYPIDPEENMQLLKEDRVAYVTERK